MKLTFREIFGLALVIVGLVLIPTAWAFSSTLTVIAFFLLVVGALLFYTDRMRKREEKLAKESSGTGYSGGSPMPTDIHNYKGWRTGGRRADSSDGHDDAGDGGGDGGGDGD
jgi:hypothetical protein